jgi:integrase
VAGESVLVIGIIRRWSRIMIYGFPVLHGRPTGIAATSLFLTVRAPRQGMTADGIRRVVAIACTRVGIPRAGAHRLRHTLAGDLQIGRVASDATAERIRRIA